MMLSGCPSDNCEQPCLQTRSTDESGLSLQDLQVGLLKNLLRFIVIPPAAVKRPAEAGGVQCRDPLDQ
jgi:hypothetical protein